MTMYLNPEKVRELGRPIPPGYPQGLDGLKRNLRAGEIVAGIYDRLIFKTAPVLTNAEDFDDFEQQYSTGMIVRREFFAFPEAEVEANRTS